jgi:hypothetical protein
MANRTEHDKQEGRRRRLAGDCRQQDDEHAPQERQ